MKALIVSASAVLRGALKEVLNQIPGKHTVVDTGSTLQVKRILEEEKPRVVLWDEALEEKTVEALRSSSPPFHLVLLVSKDTDTGKPGLPVTKMEKLDFANGSLQAYAEKQVPLLSSLFQTLEQRENAERKDGVSGIIPPVALVVLGASTGGPAATKKVLEALPTTFPCPIALVQHIDNGYESGYAQWLDENTRLRVRLARDNDAPEAGEVIVAPTETHLVCRGERFFLDDGPKVFSQKPAVDRLFSTAATVYGTRLAGVLLTGIGLDGGHGCLEIVNRGGFTLVQDEATSTVWGMPKTAYELGAASRLLPIEKIGPALLETVLSRVSR